MGRSNSFNNTGWGLTGCGAALQQRAWGTWRTVRKTLKICSKFSRASPRCVGLQHLSYEKTLGNLVLFSLKRRWLPAYLTTAPSAYGEVKEMELGSSQCWQDRRMRNNRQIQTRGRRSNFLPTRDGQAVAHAAQRGCAASILGVFHDVTA